VRWRREGDGWGGAGNFTFTPLVSCSPDAGTGKREERAVRSRLPPPQPEGRKRLEGLARLLRGLAVGFQGGGLGAQARNGEGPGRVWAGLVCVSVMTAGASEIVDS
jgi:hypothetical protein